MDKKKNPWMNQSRKFKNSIENNETRQHVSSSMSNHFGNLNHYGQTSSQHKDSKNDKGLSEKNYTNPSDPDKFVTKEDNVLNFNKPENLQEYNNVIRHTAIDTNLNKLSARNFIKEDKSKSNQFTNFSSDQNMFNHSHCTSELKQNLKPRNCTSINSENETNEDNFKIYEKLVKNCRQKIYQLKSNIYQKYSENFREVQKLFESASNDKHKTVYKNRLEIVNKQFNTFAEFVTDIDVNLSSVFSNQLTLKEECENILQGVVHEYEFYEKSLPLYAYKNEILASFKNNQVTIILADICYSTNEIIPLFIYRACKINIISCTPHSINAAISAKACKLFENAVENSIVEFETKINSEKTENTKILFTSVSKLSQKLQNEWDNDSFFKNRCIILQCDLRRNIEMQFLLHRLVTCFSHGRDFKLVLLLSPLDNISKFKNYFSITLNGNNKCIKVNVIETENIVFPTKRIWKKYDFINNENYIKEIVDTAIAIHHSNGPGDVQIFLPPSSLVGEISEILTLKFEKYHYQNEVHCIKLDENFDYSSYISKIKKNNVRNYFLTEICGEFLPLPSVVYVVDAGTCQGLQYSEEEYFYVPCLNLINQNQAIQRKHCASRNEKGICYRFFNKEDYENKMHQCELSEIYKNPLDIIIKLFEYDCKNAMQLELFDTFPKEIKEKNFLLLKNIGVIESNKLTVFGQRFMKLPYLPKYSKLIVLGIDWGFAIESIVLAALFMTKKSLFFHTNDKNIQQAANEIKSHWLLYESDTITNLYVCKKLVEKNFDKNWCDEHGVDFDVVIAIWEKTNNIIECVTKEFNCIIDYKFKEDNKSNARALQEILYKCLKDNLCVYSGHHRSGYILASDANCNTVLHPSSVLFKNTSLPHHIVFDQLWKLESRNFMINVTAVPEDISLRMNETTEKLQLTSTVIKNVGAKTLRDVIIGTRGEKLVEIENRVKEETHCNSIIIDASEEKCSITLHAPENYIKNAEKIICDILAHSKSSSCENETFILELKRGQCKIPINITWTKGALITQIETVEVPHNEVVLVNQEANHESNNQSIKCCINLTWVRRKCAGGVFISFTPNNFQVACQHLSANFLVINNKRVFIKKSENRTNKLHIPSLPLNTTSEDLKNAINTALEGTLQVQSHEIHYEYSKPFETTDEELNRMKCEIYNQCFNHLGNKEFTVTMTKPDNNEITFKALINVNNYNNLKKALNLNTVFKIDNVDVEAKVVFYFTIVCSAKIYNALQEKIKSELEDLELKLKLHNHLRDDIKLINLDKYDQDCEFMCLKFSTNYFNVLNILQGPIQKLLEGEIMTFANFDKHYRLFTYSGHLWLEALGKEIGICIIEESKFQILRLYGTSEKCQISVSRINAFLNEFALKIDLFSVNEHDRTLLVALIKKYGINLKQFIQEYKLRSAEVVIHTNQLILQGDNKNVEEACKAVYKLTSSCCMNKEAGCSMCECSFQSCIRLESCSHLWCLDCLKENLKFRWIESKTKEFPIPCESEIEHSGICNKPISLGDIKVALDHDKKEIEKLVKASLECFVKNNSQYKFCPGIDCSMLYNIEDTVDSKWQCKLCQNDFCVKCNKIYHNDVSCEDSEAISSVKAWKETQNADARFCPNCPIFLERSEGCNYVTCYNCHFGFCWICGDVFENEDLFCLHQPCQKPQE